MFVLTKLTENGTTYKKAIKEELSTPSAGKKDEIRYKIETEVFDIHDSLADTTKWVSLLTTLTSRLYNILPEEQKALLSLTDRSLIETVFTKFSEVNTRCDVQFSQEGISLVDKLLERQAKLGEIIK